MEQLGYIIQRLKKPSVLISISSQIATLLLVANINIDEVIIIEVISVICTLLTFFGIVSNPDTDNKGFGDDIAFCDKCNKNSKYIRIGNQVICTECGTKIRIENLGKTQIEIIQEREENDNEAE